MKLCMELANLLHMYALKITDEHKRKSYMTTPRDGNRMAAESTS